jgi:hypothetical protein
MKPLTIALGTLVVWAAIALDASAAWNNVFQPTLFGRLRRPTTTQSYAPVVVQSSPVACCTPAPAPACPQQCSTSYVQRCFYQPVTTYQTQTYYEPVTTYRTSYYYEPVTSYRYSCYYDPCTCSYQQVATPVTSYQLRAQSCPVQSWVARCAQVPVTTYQKSCYLQPQTTCCTTSTGALIPANGGVDVAPAAPAYPQQFPQQPPQIQVTPPQSPPPPQIKDSTAPSGPHVGNMSFTQPRFAAPPQQPNPWQAAPANRPPAAPPVKLERIVFGPESYVEGQIVQRDQTPRAGASVLFVSAETGSRQTVTANGTGRFQVNLASGNWLVYVPGRDGTPLFHSRVNVNDKQPTRITVVN